MKSFKQYTEDCWKGYEAIGVKKKNGKTVPNCVPEESELEKKASKYDFTKTKSGKPVPKQTKPFRMGNEPISNIKEDGMGAGAISAGPTNVVGGGAIAGTGGLGGEPGVNLKKKKTPIILPMGHRKPPQ